HDLGRLLPFLARLFRYRALSRVGQLDVAHLDAPHLHSPGARLLIDDLLESLIDAIPFCQEMIQVRLAKDAAKRGLSDQRSRANEIDRFHDGVTWAHDAEVHDGVDLD